ncbi:hypothetical protein ACHQM5_030456 [Ranunculus cassubicifolius]
MEMEVNRSSQICNFNNRKDMRMNDEDRLSGLLEPLLHHILSFMEMKEVVHTSLISKRWRYLWTSVRDLNFNASLWRFEEDDYELEREKFTYFVDTVLLLRDGSDVHSLSLDFSSQSDNDYTRVDRWIAYAVRRHVQLLEFYRVDIPSARSFYLCGHVNTLELCGGSIPCDSKNELVLDFPGVENLTIDSCEHLGILLLIISGPKLKFLKLSHFFHEHNYKTAVNICAPNLLELICKGYMYKDYLLENLSTLVTAEVDTQTLFPDCIPAPEEEVDTLTHFPDSLPTPEALFVRCVSKILQGLGNIRSLIISAYAFQVCILSPPFLIE